MTYFRYCRAGQGEVLVLQHGFLCGPAYWRKTVAALSHRFDVIVPTLPGFADHASAPALHSIADFADYLHSILDCAKVDRCHLLGHSMGGMIAQEMALRVRERIDRLILFGTGPIGEMPGRFETLAESLRKLKQYGPETMIENTVTTWFMRGQMDPAYSKSLATAQQASFAAMHGGYIAMQDWRSLERLGEINHPTMIIWGDGDQSYQRSQVELLLQGIPDAKLVVMSGCSHNAHLEDPATFQAYVLKFLSAREY